MCDFRCMSPYKDAMVNVALLPVERSFSKAGLVLRRVLKVLASTDMSPVIGISLAT